MHHIVRYRVSKHVQMIRCAGGKAELCNADGDAVCRYKNIINKRVIRSQKSDSDMWTVEETVHYSYLVRSRSDCEPLTPSPRVHEPLTPSPKVQKSLPHIP